ncbi:glucose-1-phosphate adenylyltransferase [Gleimia europaea]|uniref:Glucose-1-phosphate adenylyltransferase n=1 Tax=Gleimia europaea ACS-120-V-Col10b TaxID=883069 RepID=A0A9W5VW58_9ACTO|nr:glucose-1-phosphate adenylyltransferase [Gleimia europaea]EPD30574.1 glucose-1-phosphate adenylyltransferase [Gleimia europaea ACS-120-V-Col10b]
MAKHVLAIVLAGGAGSRLRPLTDDRAKPAVPFGGHFRLIDFALSNIVNSGYLRIVVLTQYKSHSLDRHITKTWRMSTLLGNYVAPVPAQQRRGEHWYQGSADAIYQSLNTIEDERPDYVVIVGADNIYRMDFSQMVDHHIASGLPCTVAGIRQPLELSSSFGVIKAENGRVSEFLEKPETTEGLPDDPNSFLASMGNYVFTTEALEKALREDAQNPDSNHDMGGDLVPWFVQNGGCGVYDFIDNVVPGSTERDADYWRDVGTLDAFYDANMDLISVHPIFNLYNLDWPTLTQIPGHLPPAKFVYSETSRLGHALDSFISPGVIISGGEVVHSILSPGVYVHSWARILDSVVMDGCRIGRNAIVSKAILDKNVIVEDGAEVGVDLDYDRERGLTVTESGITVVPKGYVIKKRA